MQMVPMKFKIGRQENWTSIEIPSPNLFPDGSSCSLHLHNYNLSPDRAIPIAGLPPGEQVHYAGHFTIANPSDDTAEKWIISIVFQPPPPPPPVDNGQEQHAGAAGMGVPPQQQRVAEAQVDWVADFSGDTSIKLPGNLGTLFYRHLGSVRIGDGMGLALNSGQYNIPLEAQVPESVLERMMSTAFWVLSVTVTYLRS